VPARYGPGPCSIGPTAACSEHCGRCILRDYGDLVGSWGAVAQLLVPSFWLLRVAALVAVPVVVIAAAVAGLVDSP